MAHWVNSYIGIPYLVGGTSREEGLDCWGLFRLIQKEQFGRDLPIVDIEKYSSFVAASVLQNHEERNNWEHTQKQENGGAALMQHMRHPTHVGVIVADEGLRGIVHTNAAVGCIFTKMDELQYSMWRLTGIYRYVG